MRILDIAVSVSLVGIASALRLGIINDIHLNTSADAADFNCNIVTKCYDLGGMLGYDIPSKLLTKALEDIYAVHSYEKKFDAFIVSGDLAAHGLSSKDYTSPNPKTQMILDTFYQVFLQLSSVFPVTPILPVFGNNDAVYHYLAPTSKDKADWY